MGQLHKIAQKHFNRFIRERDQEGDYFSCISCNQFKSVDQMHAGHFIPVGSYSALRYNEDNVHGQCVKCNMHLHGNQYEYSINLEHKLGKKRFKVLLETWNFWKRNTKKWTKDEVIDIIEKYK